MKIHEYVNEFNKALIEKNVFSSEEIEGINDLLYKGGDYLNSKIREICQLEMEMDSLSIYNQCIIMFRIQLFGSLIGDGTMTYDDSLISRILLYMDHLTLYIHLAMEHEVSKIRADSGIGEYSPSYH